MSCQGAKPGLPVLAPLRSTSVVARSLPVTSAKLMHMLMICARVSYNNQDKYCYMYQKNVNQEKPKPKLDNPGPLGFSWSVFPGTCSRCVATSHVCRIQMQLTIRTISWSLPQVIAARCQDIQLSAAPITPATTAQNHSCCLELFYPSNSVSDAV